MRFLFVLGVIVLLFSGCARQTTHIAEKSRDDRGFTLIGLSKELVQSYNKRVNANGLLEIEIILNSTSNRDVIYKIDWLDSDGFVLQDPINKEYKALRLIKNREITLKKIAIDKRAKDFAIEIQPN